MLSNDINISKFKKLKKNIKTKLNENHTKFFPISSYGESKLLSEIYLQDFL